MCSKIKEVVRVVFCGKCGLKIKDGNIFCTNCIESVEGNIIDIKFIVIKY